MRAARQYRRVWLAARVLHTHSAVGTHTLLPRHTRREGTETGTAPAGRGRLLQCAPAGTPCSQQGQQGAPQSRSSHLDCPSLAFVLSFPLCVETFVSFFVSWLTTCDFPKSKSQGVTPSLCKSTHEISKISSGFRSASHFPQKPKNRNSSFSPVPPQNANCHLTVSRRACGLRIENVCLGEDFVWRSDSQVL